MQGIRGKYVERTQDVRSARLRLGRFLRRSFFCGFLGGFDRLFEDFLVSSDSPRLAQPGWKPSHLVCPRVPASRQACSLGWSPSHLVSGSSSPSQPRQELLCSAAPPGEPFFLLPFFFRGPGAVALGHTGSPLGNSEQEVLFP